MVVFVTAAPTSVSVVVSYSSTDDNPEPPNPMPVPENLLPRASTRYLETPPSSSLTTKLERLKVLPSRMSGWFRFHMEGREAFIVQRRMYTVGAPTKRVGETDLMKFGP